MQLEPIELTLGFREATPELLDIAFQAVTLTGQVTELAGQLVDSPGQFARRPGFRRMLDAAPTITAEPGHWPTITPWQALRALPRRQTQTAEEAFFPEPEVDRTCMVTNPQVKDLGGSRSRPRTLSPANAYGDEEEHGDHEVADYRHDGLEQPDDNEQRICTKAGSQPVSEQGDFLVASVGSDESSVQRVPPEQGKKSAGDEQGQSVEGDRHSFGPIGGDVFREQPCRERKERDEEQQ
jgi:hypothetical protein